MHTLITTLLTALVAHPGAQPVLTVPSAQETTTVEAPSFEHRLELLVERMEKERVANHIPGFALAVVKDDQVVLARGFGVADVESGRAVDAETIFAIGSTTKAFTSALIGMLQDDGKMAFDDPVTKHLPAFKLPIQGPDKNGDSTVTLRDLLSHRTGFTRMTALWGSGKASRELVLETAVKAEPWAGFREKFLYNNVMYLAAGMAAAAAAETSWEDLVQSRIFDPLGMKSSTLAVSEAQKDKRLALGYEWKSDSESFEHKRMLALNTVGPAGSINSNVTDMAKWLRLQLGRGEFEGHRLISEEALKETWTANIDLSDEVSYGLGWMLHEHDGRRVIEHGGNIDGFGAQVAFLPDDGIGYVLLTNVTMTPLQAGSIPIVFDTLLGDLEEEAQYEGEFGEFVGNYRADFATFKNATFEVLVQNGNLAVDVPGQMIYELFAPDAESKWYFRITDTIAVSFDRDEAGKVVGMRMYQAGMTFELPREGVEIEPEIPLADLARFLGKYAYPERDMEVQVVIKNQRLALDVPKQMVFELHVPDADGKRRFRVTDDIAVRFNEDSEGRVATLTMFEREDVREFQRVDTGDPSAARPLPSLKEFLAVRQPEGRAQLLSEHGSLRTTGIMRVAQSGAEGNYVFEATAEPLAYHLSIDFGVFGRTEFGSDGKTAWSYVSARGYTPLTGDQLEQALRGHPLIADGDWSDSFDSLVLERFDTESDREVIVAEAKWKELPAWKLYMDAETGLLLRLDHMFIEGMVRLPMTTTYEDFRDVEGVPTWHRAIERNDATGRSIQTLLKIEPGVELAPDFHVFKGEED